MIRMPNQTQYFCMKVYFKYHFDQQYFQLLNHFPNLLHHQANFLLQTPYPLYVLNYLDLNHSFLLLMERFGFEFPCSLSKLGTKV
jgi:hypothetical protein